MNRNYFNNKKLLLFFIKYLLLMFSIGCGKSNETIFSKTKNFEIRNADFEWAPAGYAKNNINNPLVVSLDTKPSCNSKLFESVLQNFGYHYKLLGSTSSSPQPKNHGLFKRALWEYRLKRYRAQLNGLPDKKIVILTDASDVLFSAPPSEVVANFFAMGKPIVISSQMYCCNVSLYDYVKKMAKEQFGLDESDLIDPKNKELVANIYLFAYVSPAYFNRPLKPWTFWTKEAEREIDGILQIEMEPNGPATKYRYLNAGTIIGYAKNLREAIDEIDIQPFGDDEQEWSYWYTDKFAQNKNLDHATLDYDRTIFAVVDEPEGIDDRMSFLFPDSDPLPSRKFFDFTLDKKDQRWVSTYGTKTQIFHCAGCTQSKMTAYQEKIISTIDDFKNLPTTKNVLGDDCPLKI